MPPYQVPWSQESQFCLNISSYLGAAIGIQAGIDALFDLCSLTSDIFNSSSYHSSDAHAPMLQPASAFSLLSVRSDLLVRREPDTDSVITPEKKV